MKINEFEQQYCKYCRSTSCSGIIYTPEIAEKCLEYKRMCKYES